MLVELVRDTHVLPKAGDHTHTRGLSFKSVNAVGVSWMLIDIAGFSSPVDRLFIFTQQGGKT